MRILEIRNIHLRLRTSLSYAVLHFGHNTHDLAWNNFSAVRCQFRRRVNKQALSESFFVREVALCERFIDDRDAWRIFRIAVGENASLLQRNVHRAEVIGVDRSVLGQPYFARRSWTTFNLERVIELSTQR